MASRVNVKLVVALIVGLIAVGGGGVAVYMKVVHKTADENAAAGDKAMAAGEYAVAKRMYSRAVNKEPNNIEWLNKWGEAIEAWTPASDTDFDNSYRTEYIPMIRGKAFAQPDNPKAALEYLGLLYEQASLSGWPRGAVEQLDLETELLLSRMQSAAAPGNQDRLVIRRFRGLMYTELMSAQRAVEDAKVKLAEEDLRAVLDVDPKDGKAAVGLMRVMEAKAREARAAGRRERFREYRAEAMKVLEDHLARDPGDPDVLVNKLALEIDSAQDQAVEGKVGVEAMRARQAAYRAFEPQLRELAETLKTTEHELDVYVVRRLQLLEMTVLPQNRFELTLGVLDRLIASSPASSRPLMLKAILLADRGDYEQASAVLGQVSDLAPKPVSFDGYVQRNQKVRALALRANIELRQRSAMDASDEAGRAAALERAKQYRAEYAKKVPENDPELLYLTAAIAEAEGDLRKAQAEIQRYNQTQSAMTQDALRGLWFEGQVSRKLGEFGRAKAAFERILAVDPENYQALVMVAVLEERLRNPQRALEIYRQLARLNPDDESVRSAINKLEVELGLAKSDDPIEQVLVNARLAAVGTAENPGSLSQAIEILRAGLEANDQSPRLALQLANHLLALGDLDGAREVVARSLSMHPDHERLAGVNEALKGTDLYTVSMALLETAELPEIERQINRYNLSVQYGKTEQARQILDELHALAPTDPRVIELRFMDALSREDHAGAREIYRAALDAGRLSYDGLVYRARLEAVEGKHEEAINTLRQAIDLGADQAPVWRLLGAEQYQVGRLDDAIASYKRACEIQPDDIQNVKPLLELLVRRGQMDEALRRARLAERFGRNDPVFMNMWLQLEARAGGAEGVSRAILMREQMAQLNPDNTVNLLELASLYMDVASGNDPGVTDQMRKENWAKSRAIIDQLKAKRTEVSLDDLPLVILEARWYADQGRITHEDGTVTDGIDDARGVFVEYIVELGDKATAAPYIELARFMTQRGRYGIAKQSLMNAREFQSEQLEADKVLAALHMELGEPALAEPLFEKIVNANVDDEQESFRVRWIEMLLRQGKYAQAAEQLAKLDDSLQESLTVLLQRSETADGLGDQAEAARLLDRAVSLYPDNPLAYTRRAEFRVRDTSLLSDVLADLEQALKLDPKNTQTLRLRAGVYGSVGRYDEMVRDLTTALRADPYLTDVLEAIMIEHINNGRDGQAMDIVEETLAKRPRDLMLLARAGRIFDDRGLWTRSVRLYERGWQLSGDIGFGLAYINALISQQPPQTRRADQVLREIKTLGPEVANDWQVVFADAAIRYRAGRREEAERGLFQQYGQLVDSPPVLTKWWRNLMGLYSEDTPGLEAFCRRLLEAQESGTNAEAWAKLFLSQILVAMPSKVDEGIALLEELIALGPDSSFALLGYRQAGSALYAQQRYEEALAMWARGLEDFPGDWEMCNNSAYLLATRLNRPEEAKPFAESAVAAAPEQPDAHDTMARVHIALGDLEAATQDLELAKRHVNSRRAELSVTLTQAELDLKTGKIARARRTLERTLLAITPLPDLRKEYEDQIRDLLRRIDSLEG